MGELLEKRGCEEDKWNRKKVGEGAKVSKGRADERIERGGERFRSREELWLGKKEPRR
jgi:hypothetical protein